LREWKCELSTVDTGLLMMGVLFCQSYFDRDDSVEMSLRHLADSLYRRVDWQWAMDGRKGIHAWMDAGTRLPRNDLAGVQ